MVLISEISANENNNKAETQILVPLASGCRKGCYIERAQHNSLMRFERLDHGHCVSQPLFRMLVRVPKIDLTDMWNAPISKLMECLENARTYIRRDTVKMPLILSENNSQNFSDETKNVTGWEIQLYVSNPIHDQGFCIKKDPNHRRLIQVLREMIVRKLAPTRLAGEIRVSFQLPEDCDVDVILMVDKLQRLPTHQFSFLERLEGWRIERRQRSNGRFDLYYHHGKAHRTFRSTIEVVNFLLYEAYPDKLQKAHKGPLEGDDSAHKYEYRGKTLKRKWTSPNFKSSCKSKKEMKSFSSKVCERHKTETVEHFLAASYEKFLSSTSSSSNHGSEAKRYTVFSSESKEQARKRKMVEDFLDASHKNLLTYFKTEEIVPKGNDPVVNCLLLR